MMHLRFDIYVKLPQARIEDFEMGGEFWPGRRQRNVAKAWKRGVFGLHAGQCVCGLEMNKLIGRTSHCLCTLNF